MRLPILVASIISLAAGTASAQPSSGQPFRIFFDWGARIVVGTHAHVVQPTTCTADRAVWYGLGNHLFDQRPVSSHVGRSGRS